MIFDKFEIIKKNNNYVIISSKSSQEIPFEYYTKIESIFWYPIIERDILEFKKSLTQNKFNDFPIKFMIKNVIMNGTYYWVDKALNWYREIDFYDLLIQEKLINILKLEQNNFSQKFRQKIKNIIVYKNRFMANELYRENKNSINSFILELEKTNIPYKLLSHNNSILIVNGCKFIFPS